MRMFDVFLSSTTVPPGVSRQSPQHQKLAKSNYHRYQRYCLPHSRVQYLLEIPPISEREELSSGYAGNTVQMHTESTLDPILLDVSLHMIFKQRLF